MAKVVTVAGPVIAGLPVGENLVAGDLVGWSDSTLVRACGAVGNVIPALGVALASYKSGEKGAMALMGEITGFSGLTIGAAQYLSLSTAGGIQTTVPTGSGNLKQAVGFVAAADRVALTFQDAGVTL